MLLDFEKKGWCHFNNAKMDTAIELLIDEILEFSHYIFKRSVPELKSLREKSSYLSEIVAEFSIKDRTKVSYVYDAIKNLPSFHSLYAHPTLLNTCRTILNSRKILTLKDSVGIRIDLPRETQQLTNIHQEFHSFPYGLEGLVVWLPLTPVNEQNGTIKLFEGSNKELFEFSGDRLGINSLIGQNRFQEAQKVGKLHIGDEGQSPKIITAEVGEILIISATTLHASHPSEKQRFARLTCQFRVFNYSEEFFLWKSENYSFNEGLKQPIAGQELYNEFRDKRRL